jgi:hypothetical protein
MPAERLEASNILYRDHRLMKKTSQLIEPFAEIQLFARHSLALFADMNLMAASAELLVRTRLAANSAKVSHALRGCRALARYSR